MSELNKSWFVQATVCSNQALKSVQTLFFKMWLVRELWFAQIKSFLKSHPQEQEGQGRGGIMHSGILPGSFHLEYSMVCDYGETKH